MVFIVKIPNRSRGGTPDPSAPAPPSTEEGPAQSQSQSNAEPQAAAAVDVLLAPSVLKHRYVRGVDKSLIVERPERVRAVLLGVAGAIGQLAERPPPTPLPSSDDPDDPDDLVARLGSLSVNNAPSDTAMRIPSPVPVRVLHSTHSLALDPPHPAVAYVHAHSDETVQVLDPLYANKRGETIVKREMDHDPTITSTPLAPSPSTQDKAISSSATAETSHAAYLAYLCSLAPNQPPVSQLQAHANHASSSSAASTGTIDSEAYTSSDGEGDEALHPSEIPEHLPQGDLYLAGPEDGGSSEAIRHAIGACAEAVDRVVAASRGTPLATSLPEVQYHAELFSHPPPTLPARRAFVISRPPGHHCAGSSPSGFCWVNNAVVAASHAYLEHGIDRVVIFDIDLHHGNGTQSLAWRINADAQRHDLEREARMPPRRGTGRKSLEAAAAAAAAAAADVGPRALRLFYSSIHDIESFPCEDGDPTLIKDASVCVEGAHGQWIWNVHLDHYKDEADFARLYSERYAVLFDKAARFLAATDAHPDSTLVLISAGFDACSYEYPGMQRHGKHVPPSFYDRFARDALCFAETQSRGKLVSLLEGGYSDRALCSAALAHMLGLAQVTPAPDAGAWRLDKLVQLEKMAKRMAATATATATATGSGSGRRSKADAAAWLGHASRAFAAFERVCGKQLSPLGFASPSPSKDKDKERERERERERESPSTSSSGPRVLRDRNALKPRSAWDPTPTSSPSTTKRTKASASPAKTLRSVPVEREQTPTPQQHEQKQEQEREQTPTPLSFRESAAESKPPVGLAFPPTPPAASMSVGLTTPAISAAPIMLVDAMHDHPHPTATIAQRRSSLGLVMEDGTSVVPPPAFHHTSTDRP